MKRLGEILLVASTEYAELLLGAISSFMGLWLLTSLAHPGFCSKQLCYYVPEQWGTLLLFSGSLKLFGVLKSNFKLRMISCMCATVTWFLLSVTFIRADQTAFSCLTAPITMILSLFNALIYIKLKAVTR